MACVDFLESHVDIQRNTRLGSIGDFPLNSELEKLKNECELIQNAIVKPFYWAAILLTLLMVLPVFFAEFPACGVTHWHVFAAIGISCVAQFAVGLWRSFRIDRTIQRHYPEIFAKTEDE